MGKINVLSIDVANKIAAGEVVERPASVIKELVENSLDAGSSRITVEIQNGGISYMRVTDNGCGMHRDDVQKAFLRHATSKLKDAEDLESIETLGFRGEALASIAAVSRIDIMTKETGGEEGYTLELHGGQVINDDAAGCPDGTTIIVRDIFYNTPARMKFLKSDRTEASYIADVIERIALCRPDVAFKFIQDSKIKIQTNGDNNLKSSIYSIYGVDYVNNIREVDCTESGIRVCGIVGMPELSRGNRRFQSFFVNGRYVKSSTMTAAAEEAFKNKLTVGKFPFFVLNVNIPLSQVDVNVHPRKTEVKFSDERKLYQAVYWAVYNAIMMPSAKLDAISESNNGVGLQGVYEKEEAKSLYEGVTPVSYASTQSQRAEDSTPKKDFKATHEREMSSFEMPSPKQAQEIIKQLHETLAPEQKTLNEGFKPMVYEAEQPMLEQVEAVKDDYKIIGQAFDTYIIIQTGNEIQFIDQHAAHERQIYEKLIQNKIQIQYMLVPCMVSLSAAEHSIVMENLSFFENLGFEIDDFGNNSIAVRQTPLALDGADIKSLITEIIENISVGKRFVQTDSQDRALYTIACKAAIKANKEMSEQEMKALVDWVISRDGIDTCPHGRPLTCKFTKNEIEKMFKRT